MQLVEVFACRYNQAHHVPQIYYLTQTDSKTIQFWNISLRAPPCPLAMRGPTSGAFNFQPDRRHPPSYLTKRANLSESFCMSRAPRKSRDLTTTAAAGITIWCVTNLTHLMHQQELGLGKRGRLLTGWFLNFNCDLRDRRRRRWFVQHVASVNDGSCRKWWSKLVTLRTIHDRRNWLRIRFGHVCEPC